MITGYFTRGSGTWALVQMDEHYRETVVADGLSYEDAVALYWGKLGELTACAADAAPDRPEPRQRWPSQLSLKL